MIKQISLMKNTCTATPRYISISDDDIALEYIVTTKDNRDNILSKAPYTYDNQNKVEVLTELVNAYYNAGYIILRYCPKQGELKQCYRVFE